MLRRNDASFNHWIREQPNNNMQGLLHRDCFSHYELHRASIGSRRNSMDEMMKLDCCCSDATACSICLDRLYDEMCPSADWSTALEFQLKQKFRTSKLQANINDSQSLCDKYACVTMLFNNWQSIQVQTSSKRR